MLNFRLINKLRSKKPCVPPVACIQDEMAIHDLYRAMVNNSIVLAHDLIVDRLIGNIRVYITKKGYAKITN